MNKWACVLELGLITRIFYGKTKKESEQKRAWYIEDEKPNLKGFWPWSKPQPLKEAELIHKRWM